MHQRLHTMRSAGYDVGMAAIARIYRSAATLWRVAWIRWCLIVGIFGIIGDTVNAFTWIGQNWCWLMSWANTDLFRVVFAAGILAILSYGIWRVARGLDDQKLAGDTEARERDRVHLARLDEMERYLKAVPERLMHGYIMSLEAQRFGDEINKLKDIYINERHNLESQAQTKRVVNGMSYWWLSGRFMPNFMFSTFEVNVPPPDVRPNNPDLVSQNGGWLYDPSLNQAYIDSLAISFGKMDGWFVQLEQRRESVAKQARHFVQEARGQQCQTPKIGLTDSSRR